MAPESHQDNRSLVKRLVSLIMIVLIFFKKINATKINATINATNSRALLLKHTNIQVDLVLIPPNPFFCNLFNKALNQGVVCCSNQFGIRLCHAKLFCKTQSLQKQLTIFK